MIDLVLNNYTTDKTYDRNFFERLINLSIDTAGLKTEKIGVSINLVGTGRIKALNKKYRKKNKVTDVLSFPMNPNKSRAASNGEVDIKKKGNDIMDLGDIFVCLPVIKKEAKREYVSKHKSTGNPAKDQKSIDEISKNKIAQAAVHGFLHLL